MPRSGYKVLRLWGCVCLSLGLFFRELLQNYETKLAVLEKFFFRTSLKTDLRAFKWVDFRPNMMKIKLNKIVMVHF